jgi:hypothetical protein
MSGFYTTGIPPDGKMYNLGLPREFEGCATNIPPMVPLGAPKVGIIQKARKQ